MGSHPTLAHHQLGRRGPRGRRAPDDWHASAPPTHQPAEPRPASRPSTGSTPTSASPPTAPTPTATKTSRDREAALALGIRVAVHDSRQNDRNPVIWLAGQDYRAADAIHTARLQPTRTRRGPERLGPER